jgi:hypothetical protein
VVLESPTLFIDNEELEVVDQFTYLGSSVNNKLFLDQGCNIRIGKAATKVYRRIKTVWENKKFTVKKKILVTSLCSHPLFYGSETWTNYMCQGAHLTTSTCGAYVEFWELSGRKRSQTMT